MRPVTFGPAAADGAARSNEMRALGHLLPLELAAGLGNVGVRCQGLIDTGASDVAIDYRLAQRLGLEPVDQRGVGVVGGADVQATVYMAVLRVPRLGFEQVTPIFGLRVRRPTHDVLIGRSFLQASILTLDGPNGVFHLELSGGYAPEPFDE